MAHPPTARDADSDEALRLVYGDNASFTRSGMFTLIHLDDPPPALVAERTRDFSPSGAYGFVDGCPVCQKARNEGGHVVFDGSGDQGNESSARPEFSAILVAVPLKVSAVAVLRALERVDAVAAELVSALEAVGSADLLERTIGAIGSLHDRFVDAVWEEDLPTRREALESLVAQATSTLEEIGRTHDALAPFVGLVEGPLREVAGIVTSL